MAEVKELKLTIKNDDKKMVQKETSYEDITVSENDPVIKALMEKSRKEFKDEAESVVVDIKLVI